MAFPSLGQYSTQLEYFVGAYGLGLTVEFLFAPPPHPVLTRSSRVMNHVILIPRFLLAFGCSLFQLALLGLITYVRIMLIPVCNVQLTQPLVELLLQVVPASQDTSELQMMAQRLHVLVSQLQSFHKSAYV